MKLQEHLKTAEQHPISTLQQTLWRVAESIGSGVQFLSLNAGFFTQLFDLGQVIESGNTGITGKLPLETFSHLKVAPQWELPGGPQKAKEATMDKPRVRIRIVQPSTSLHLQPILSTNKQISASHPHSKHSKTFLGIILHSGAIPEGTGNLLKLRKIGFRNGENTHRQNQKIN